MSVLNNISIKTGYSPKDIRLMCEKEGFLPEEIEFLINNTPTKDGVFLNHMVGRSKMNKITNLGAIYIKDNIIVFDVSQLFKSNDIPKV